MSGRCSAEVGASPRTSVWTTDAAEDEVTLSPDGTRVAFVRGGSPNVISWQRTERGCLECVPLADGRETQLSLSEVISSPAWSPDGRRLALPETSGRSEESTGLFGGEII